MGMISCPLCGKQDFRILTKKERQVVSCMHDDLAFVNPIPPEKDIAALYMNSYKKDVRRYMRNKETHLRYFRKKLTYIEKRTEKKGKILDVGCATGLFLDEAKKSGWQESGIDISPYALSYCRKKGLHVMQGTLTEVLLPADSFDVVVSLETIEHERNPVRHVQEIYRLLKPGGMAFFTTPDHDGWSRKLMGSRWFGYRHAEHFYFLSRKTMRTLLKKTGFKNIETGSDDTRIFTLGYYIERVADFYPHPAIRKIASWIQRIAGNIFIPAVANPWEDMIVCARKGTRS